MTPRPVVVHLCGPGAPEAARGAQLPAGDIVIEATVSDADGSVMLVEFSGHAVWANSLALRMVGIDRDTVPEPRRARSSRKPPISGHSW